MSALLTAKGLLVRYQRPSGLFAKKSVVHAINGVDLEIRKGEVLGLVGESGSGKSTLGRALLGLVPLEAGSVLFDGRELAGLGDEALRPFRKRMQLVFQDPYGSLNPRQSIEAMLGEAISFHRMVPPERTSARVDELLDLVGLGRELRARLPHELSGGQRQRVGIARALSVEPELIVADEPVSALDVSVRAQILQLLVDLKARLGLTILFIAHDLSVVKAIADRVAVMYLGRIVELLPADRLDAEAKHPYTRALLASAPSLERGPIERAPLGGEPPSPLVLPPGCAFAGRCPQVEAGCRDRVPSLEPLAADHLVACPVVGPTRR
jgi:peptide/nickel transport system ATP-binding protein